MKTTAIYHSADFDGIFCREIAKKFLPEDAEFIGWDFGDEPLKFPAEGPVYVMDLPVDRVFGFTAFQTTDAIGANAWGNPGGGLVWIDHHKSSIDTHPPSLPGFRIDGVAACRLVWQWFTQKKALPNKQAFIERSVVEPLAVRLAGEYDIWDKRDPRAEVFQFGLRSRELSREDWEELLRVNVKYGTGLLDDLLHDGALLQRYQEQIDASVVKHRTWKRQWEGLTFLCLNSARFNSLTFKSLDVPETGHDALLGFRYAGNGQWSVSLYHADHRKDLDLSAIAKKHGGGGHRGACGFTTQDVGQFL